MLNQQKKNVKQINTIDEKHKEMLNYFQDIENIHIPKLIKEKKDR